MKGRTGKRILTSSATAMLSYVAAGYSDQQSAQKESQKKEELNPKISYKIPLLQLTSCFIAQIMLTFTSRYIIVYCCQKFKYSR